MLFAFGIERNRVWMKRSCPTVDGVEPTQHPCSPVVLQFPIALPKGEIEKRCSLSVTSYMHNATSYPYPSPARPNIYSITTLLV
jgi:hypothetical protein